VVQELYGHINELFDAVKKPDQTSSPSDIEGRPGDLRLVKGDKGKYGLEGRYRDGWVAVQAGATTGTGSPALFFGAGTIDTVISVVQGGAVIAGSDPETPEGEIVIQVKTSAGEPTHVASVGTPCWNSVDRLLYVSNGDGRWERVRSAPRCRTEAHFLDEDYSGGYKEIQLEETPVVGSEIVIHNGLVLTPGDDRDYNIFGRTLTVFQENLSQGDAITVKYNF